MLSVIDNKSLGIKKIELAKFKRINHCKAGQRSRGHILLN